MEIKIDKTTLPKDESRVRFKVSFDNPWVEGHYFEEDELFIEELGKNGKAHYAWFVHEWEYV